MRVGVYRNNRDVKVEEREKPKIGSGEVLVKVEACGICGTDVLEWYRIKKAPLVLGHEATGEIVEVGQGVENYKLGDRVFVSHHVPCNTCHYCLNDHHTACETLHTTNYEPGGFSEYIRVPKINVDRGIFLLPNEVSFEDGTFIEPLACVFRGQRLARMKPGNTILILGSGISGLLHLKLARALGGGRIIVTDRQKYRLEMANEFGADAAIRSEEDLAARLTQLNNGKLADTVIVCTSALSAFEQALKAVDRGGTILFFASTEPGISLPIPIEDFWRNEITMITSYAASPADITAAIELIRSGRVTVNQMITHRLSLEEIGLGFRLMIEGEGSLKIVIKPAL